LSRESKGLLAGKNLYPGAPGIHTRRIFYP
jgi:hypothetical protein